MLRKLFLLSTENAACKINFYSTCNSKYKLLEKLDEKMHISVTIHSSLTPH